MFIDGYKGLGVVGPTTDAVFCFLLPAYFLWYNRNTPTVIPLKKIAYFWISLGLIVQNLFGLLFYYTGDKLQHTDFVLYVIGYIIKDCFDIFGLILFALAFYNAKYAKYLQLNH